jgi:hypothetical protein
LEPPLEPTAPANPATSHRRPKPSNEITPSRNNSARAVSSAFEPSKSKTLLCYLLLSSHILPQGLKLIMGGRQDSRKLAAIPGQSRQHGALNQETAQLKPITLYPIAYFAHGRTSAAET